MAIQSPVVTQRISLPYNQLSDWREFEHLIVSIISKNARLEAYESYRKPGANQEGIDIYTTEKLEEKPVVYQCKKELQYYPSDIEKAVTRFLKGAFAEKAKKFILCYSSKADTKELFTAKEDQRKRLHALSIEFATWEPEHLDELLYQYPDIVRRYFGFGWVQAFNGEEAYQQLKNDPVEPVKIKYPPILNYIIREVFADGDNHQKVSAEFYRTKEEKHRPTLSSKIEKSTGNGAKLILLASAGHGKSQELLNLAHLYSADSSIYWPVYIPLRNYTGESIEDFAEASTKNWKGYPKEKTVLLLDALDELNDKLYAVFISKLNQYTSKFPEINAVVSARTIAYASTNDPSSEQLQGFNSYYLAKPAYGDIYSYLQKRLGENFGKFYNLLYKHELSEWLELPFFLNLLIERFLEDPQVNNFPNKSELIDWFISKRISSNKAKYIHHHRSLAVVQNQISRDAGMLAYAMTLLGRSSISENELIEIFKDTDRISNLRYSEVITSNGNIDTTYLFDHNNFREFLTAKILEGFNLDTIKKLITFSPDHLRIQPKWINVLAMFYGLADSNSPMLSEITEWIIRSQPELLLEMEPDKLSPTLRVDVCKQVILSKKHTTVYIYDENLRLNSLVSFSAMRSEMIDFLIEELLSPLPQSFEPYLLDIIYTLCCTDTLNKITLAQSVKEKLISIAQKPTPFTIIQRESLECLANNFQFTKLALDQLIEKCPSTSNRRVREAFYQIINSSSLVNLYVNFLLIGIPILQKEKDSNSREIVSMGFEHEKALGSVNEIAAMKELLQYLENHLYLVYDSHTNKLALTDNLLTRIFSNAAAIRPIDESINKIVLSILDKISSTYTKFNIEPFRVYLFETRQSRDIILHYINLIDTPKAKDYFFVDLLVPEDFDWLYELQLGGKLTDKRFTSIIRLMPFYNKNELYKLYLERFRDKFPEHPFSMQAPIVDGELLDRRQEQNNQSLLLNKDNFLSEGIAIFKLVGKTEVNFEEIHDFEFENGSRRSTLSNTIVIHTIGFEAAGHLPYTQSAFIEKYTNVETWDDFVFNKTLELIDSGKTIYEPG